MSRRPPETAADYVLVGLNPLLIMVLIASVTFFLVEVFYQGAFEGRLAWVFAMFIMGAVGVCRISMEEGSEYASMYAVPLAGASLFVLSTFVSYERFSMGASVAFNTALLALIWYLAYKLTWDCTYLEDRPDTADQGLLFHFQGEGEATPENKPDELSSAEKVEAAQLPAAWKKWFAAEKTPHAHGLWVVYFSLGALPIFGLGQWYVEASARRWVFNLLVIYVTSALALLLSTSFLGLRRYLRKRRLEMPLDMTFVWMGAGGAMILSVVLLCMLIPRPGAEIAVSRLPFVATTPTRSPSKWGWGREAQQHSREAPQQGENKGKDDKQGNKSEESKHTSSKQGGEPGKSGGVTDKKSPGTAAEKKGKASGEKAQQDKKGGPAPKNGTPQGKTPQSSPQAPPPPTSNIFASLFWLLTNLLKLALLLAVIAVAAYYAWKHWAEIQAAWQRLLQELRDLWNKWFGVKTSATNDAPRLTLPSRRSFSSYGDPFADGSARRLDARALLRYTFEALEAWGAENGQPRNESETPLEYLRRLAVYAPHLSEELGESAELYCQAAYAERFDAGSIQPLRSLWKKLRESPVAV